jgi:hypothetical protein
MNLASNPITRLLAIVLLLSGCASAPQHLTDQSKSGIKNIAIVSLVPNNVNFEKIGIFSSSDIYTKFDAGSKVTDSVLYVSRARIAKSYPGWTLKNIEYDRSALLAKLNTVSGFDTASAREAFADLARKNSVDAIFVVRAAADRQSDMQQDNQEYYLREGMSVLLKDNNIGGDAKLVFRANLSVTILGKDGNVMAAGLVPARLDQAKKFDLDEYGVSLDMTRNTRPETQDRLASGVIVDLTRRLNLCFDSLGFTNGANPESQHVQVIPQPKAAVESREKPPVQAGSATNSFDLCFSRCRQYTDRTKEQCFDACNK